MLFESLLSKLGADAIKELIRSLRALFYDREHEQLLIDARKELLLLSPDFEKVEALISEAEKKMRFPSVSLLKTKKMLKTANECYLKSPRHEIHEMKERRNSDRIVLPTPIKSILSFQNECCNANIVEMSRDGYGAYLSDFAPTDIARNSGHFEMEIDNNKITGRFMHNEPKLLADLVTGIAIRFDSQITDINSSAHAYSTVHSISIKTHNNPQNSDA